MHYVVTNYTMGRAAERKTADTLTEARRIAERMPARGLPGSGRGAGSASRVVGIKLER